MCHADGADNQNKEVSKIRTPPISQEFERNATIKYTIKRIKKDKTSINKTKSKYWL